MVKGHPYTDHYHDEVQWYQETEQMTLIDDTMKENIQDATNEEDQKKVLKASLDMKVKASQQKRQSVSCEIRVNIQEVEKHGLAKTMLRFFRVKKHS